MLQVYSDPRMNSLEAALAFASSSQLQARTRTPSQALKL